MSAALVESVRAVLAARTAFVAAPCSCFSGEHDRNCTWSVAHAAEDAVTMQLPAILAALTEGEALRARVAAGQDESRRAYLDGFLEGKEQGYAAGVAASQAREYALVEALGRAISAALHARPWIPEEHVGARTIVNEATAAAKAVLNAPTDTAALRAMLEAAVLAGGRWVARRRDGSEPLSAAGYAQEAADERVEELGDPDDPDTKRIVDRVLGGS